MTHSTCRVHNLPMMKSEPVLTRIHKSMWSIIWDLLIWYLETYLILRKSKAIPSFKIKYVCVFASELNMRPNGRKCHDPWTCTINLLTFLPIFPGRFSLPHRGGLLFIFLSHCKQRKNRFQGNVFRFSIKQLDFLRKREKKQLFYFYATRNAFTLGTICLWTIPQFA